MIQDFAWHQITKGARIVILPPTIEEVLQDGFNYPDYIQKYIKKRNEEDDEELEKLLYNEPLDHEIHMNSPLEDALVHEGLLETYSAEMSIIQKQYEEDLISKKVTMNYNDAMKKVAQKYYNILQDRGMVIPNMPKGKSK